MTIRLRALGLVELVPVYAKDGAGSEGNRPLLASIIEHVKAAGRPAIVGGDFNMPPDVVQGMLDSADTQLTVCAGQVPTCVMPDTVSVIDMFVLNRTSVAWWQI